MNRNRKQKKVFLTQKKQPFKILDTGKMDSKKKRNRLETKNQKKKSYTKRRNHFFKREREKNKTWKIN